MGYFAVQQRLTKRHLQLDLLIKQMAAQEGVTEQLKASDQMAWVGAMNNIRARAEEVVRAELFTA